MKLPFILSLLLRPLGFAYGLAMAVRRLLWECGLRKRMRVAVPVVSVGNISLGGTGKTPLVDWLLSWAAQRDLGVAVLTRGYGGSPPQRPYLVEHSHSPEHTGDEPLMLARNHPEARVLVDRKRRRSATWARANMEAELFLMDDGFQHIALMRDVDIVLLRPDDLAGQWNAVLPSGCWREGASALKRASIFGMKAEPAVFERLEPLIRQRLDRFGKPIFSFSYRPSGLFKVEAHDEATGPARATDLGGAGYVFMTGVGNPGHARATAAQLLGPPAAHLTFSDHHPFSAADIERAALRYPGLPLVCTAKDSVKISRALVTARRRPETWALDISLQFGPCLGIESFPAWWEATVDELLSRDWSAVAASERI